MSESWSICQIALQDITLYRIFRDWLHEQSDLCSVHMDGYRFKYHHMLAVEHDGVVGGGYQSYAEGILGGIDPGKQEIALITGIIRIADPECFQKLKPALQIAKHFYSALFTERQRTMDTIYSKIVPANYVITAQDVINYFGNPKML